MRRLALGLALALAGCSLAYPFEIPEDAGVRDGGAADADLPDAELPDAELPDAGSSDAGPDAQVVDPPDRGFEVVRAGEHHTCALRRTDDGRRVYCWGRGTEWQTAADDDLGTPTEVPLPVGLDLEDLTLGGDSSCVRIRSDSTFRCWGANQRGQLGQPIASMRFVPATDPVAIEDVSALGLSDNFACGVNGSRTSVRCWGEWTDGQLGNGLVGARPPDDLHIPVEVELPAGDVLDLAVGARHACAIVRPASGSTELYCWGSNLRRQVSSDAASVVATPRRVTPLEAPSRVFAGSTHTCAVAGEAIYCWGGNSSSELALGTVDVSAPTPLEGLASDAELAFAGRALCALEAGQVRCRGRAADGVTGDASSDSTSPPQEALRSVDGLEGMVTSLAVGEEHACAVVDGDVHCWGSDAYGQIGAGAVMESAARPVTGLADVASVVVGASAACAIHGGDRRIAC